MTFEPKTSAFETSSQAVKAADASMAYWSASATAKPVAPEMTPIEQMYAYFD